MMDADAAAAYRDAFAAWLEQITRLHRVLLDGEAIDPIHRVALLRRESHLKARYDEARARFLGLPADDGGSSPFPE